MVKFERNAHSHVSNSSKGEVAEDLKAIFKVGRHKTAEALAGEFVSLYEKSYPKAMAVLETSLEDAFTFVTWEATLR